MNGVEVENTGKYAVAGGNEEIIHLCEQNHSSFEGAYEAAIMFHRNDVFHYLYENKLAPDIGITQTLLESKCLEFCNYELIEFVETNFTESNNVKEKILCEIPALSMNIYNVLYLYAKKKLSVSKFIELRNYDVAQFILDHKLVNIYKKNNYLIYFSLF